MEGSTRQADVVIVGAGVIGLLLARELASAGVDVALVERHALGREASRAAGGILSPLCPWATPAPVSALATWSQDRYPDLLESLRQETGIDPEFRRSGMLLLGEQDVAAARRWALESGQSVESLDESAMARLEPAVAAGEALRLPSVGQLRNPCYMEALEKSVRASGARIVEFAGACRLLEGDGRIKGALTDQGLVAGRRVVLAAGAWSGEILAQIGIRSSVEPVLGQMVWYRVAPDLVGHIVLRDGRYIIPRRDGVLLVGSTMEHSGFDKTVTDAAAADLHRAAAGMVPSLADHEIQGQWAGLRPAMPDGVPCIGAVPGIDGLFVSAGHFRNGVTLAPASTRLLADLMLDRPPEIDPAPFDPARHLAVGGATTYNASA